MVIELSPRRLFAMVVALEAIYFAVRGLGRLISLDTEPDLWPINAVSLVLWPIVLGAGAWALWDHRLSETLAAALLRALLRWTVTVANLFFVVTLITRPEQVF